MLEQHRRVAEDARIRSITGAPLVHAARKLIIQNIRVTGEVSEWPKEHAWKVCIPQGIEVSNPSLSAIIQKALFFGAFFIMAYSQV